MKTIIAGCRDFTGWRKVIAAILHAEVNGIKPTAIICGMAKGVDETGYWFAKMARLPVIECPPEAHGPWPACGPLRNRFMAEQADALIAVWDGESPGTASMIREAERCGLKMHVEILK